MEPQGKNPNHILTSSKISFDPTNPKDADIAIEDIAHALSMMTRANGHLNIFYSVAQHSINCSVEAEKRRLSREIQLACLLHDASEAYLADITRPVKQKLSQYESYESRLQRLIFDKFGLGALSDADFLQVKAIDDAFLHHEFKALHGTLIYEEEPILLSNPDFKERPYREMKKEFLSVYNRLTGMPSK